MITSKIRTVWIVLKLTYLTAILCIGSILKSIFSEFPRKAVNEALHYWAEQFLKAVDMTCTVHDLDKVSIKPNQRIILMSNHGSIFDFPLIYYAFPYTIRMIAKKELFKVPIFSRAMIVGEFISIDRKNRSQAVKDLDRAKELMEDGVYMWVAPEGTRSRDGQLGAFKKGPFWMAIQTNAIIIPFGIRGAREALAPTSFNLQLGVKGEIYVGTPIDTAEYGIDQRDELRDIVEKQIRTLADL